MTDTSLLALVVEDDPSMARFLRATLEGNGFRVVSASLAREALALFTSHNPAIVLLDMGLPDGDGLSVTKQLRASSGVPIVILSARGREAEKVEALDAGADDYVTKPFGTNELVARIRVALRHAAREESAAPERVVVGPLVIDRDKRLVTLDGNVIRLTPIEYKMLALLAKHLGKVVTHKQMLTEVWGPSYTQQTHYLRVHMAELRRKLETQAARPRFVTTEAGVGYRLRES